MPAFGDMAEPQVQRRDERASTGYIRSCARLKKAWCELSCAPNGPRAVDVDFIFHDRSAARRRELAIGSC